MTSSDSPSRVPVRVRIMLACLSGVLVALGQTVTAAPAHAVACSPTSSTDGTATILSFTTVGTCTWTVPGGVTVIDNILIVGGGGGGGFDIGGGGGAGGLVDLTAISVTPGSTVTIIVGAGGAGATGYTQTSANSGTASSFASHTALGGGYGGSGSFNGAAGGSGGGAGYAAGGGRAGGAEQQSTAPTAGLGSTGGASPWLGTPPALYLVDAGGGGGGAGGVGGQVFRDLTVWPDAQGGSGGTGVTRSITGTAQSYAGGGGGGSQVRIALGGSGVGGDGGVTSGSPIYPAGVAPGAGASNTGSGGGGGRNGGVGGAGGSGVVITRWTTSSVVVSATVAPIDLTPSSWHQSVGRPGNVQSCPSGWSASWAQWMNVGTGGWVCNREYYWDTRSSDWGIR